jgi:hypothetical protein
MPGFWDRGNNSSSSIGGNGSGNTNGAIMDTAIVSPNGSASDLSGTAASSLRLRQRRGAAASIVPPSSPPPGSRSSANSRVAAATTTTTSNESDDDDHDNAVEEAEEDDDDNRSTSSALSLVARAAATAALAALSGSASSLSHSNHNATTIPTSNSATTTATTTTSSSAIFQTNIPRLCVAFLASITTGGTTYAFGLYGNALKKNLHLTQSELDTISTANFCAGALSWIPGLLVDYFGTRFGISMGGILCSMALMMYWHVAKHGLDDTGWILSSSLHVNEDPSVTTAESVFLRTMVVTDDNDDETSTNATMIVATLSALGVMIFLSCSLITGSVFKIIVNSCGPGSKGNAVGIAKAYVGLGAGAYACFFESIRQPETTDLEFLPMCAVFFLVAAVVPSLCVLPTKQQELERQQRLLQEEHPPPPTRHRSSSSSSSPASSTNIVDVTTPRHFHVLFTSLFSMASIIVGNSLLTLYRSSSNDHRHPPSLQEDIIVGMEDDNDDNVFDGTVDDQYEVEFQLSKMQPVTNTDPRMTFSSSRGPNYPLALLLLLVWIAPIVSLVFLPPSGSTTTTAQGTEEADNDEERESLLHVEEPAMTDDQGATAAGDTKWRTKAMDKSSSLSTSTSDAFPLGDALQRQQDADDIEGDNRPDDNDDEEENEEDASNDKNLLQMLFTPAAWLMLFTTTILVGGGTVETNNLGQMVESLRFPEIVTPAALALFSVAQSLSRALTGALSETALNSYTNCKGRPCGTDHGGVPRTVFLIAASVAGFVAHSLLAVSTTLGPFVVGVFLSGAAFGMVWPLMVLIVGEVFGTAHMAANYMFFDGFTSAGGTLLLSKVVAQEVYERHILTMFVSPTTDVDISAMISVVVPRPGDEEGNDMGDGMGEDDTAGDVLLTMGDGVTCYGHECFRLTHVIIAALSLLCVVSSIAMQYVTRHIYNKSSRHRH